MVIKVGQVVDTTGLAVDKNGELKDTPEYRELIKSSRVNIANLINKEINKDFPTVVVCNNIREADEIKEELKRVFGSNKVSIIHSQLTKKRQKEIMSDFKTRKIECLVSVRMLNKGVDIPMIGNIVLASPKRNLADIMQIVGRG